MLVTPAGIVTDVRLRVALNAFTPILVRVEGREMEVIVESAKPLSAIPVTPSGTTTAPAHSEDVVTTLLAMVNVPPPPQLTVASATAVAGAVLGTRRVIVRNTVRQTDAMEATERRIL